MKRINIAMILATALVASLGSLQAEQSKSWRIEWTWMGTLTSGNLKEFEPRKVAISFQKLVSEAVPMLWGGNVVAGGRVGYDCTIDTNFGLTSKHHAVIVSPMLGFDLYGSKQGRTFWNNVMPTVFWSPNVSFVNDIKATTFSLFCIGAKWRLPWRGMFAIESGYQHVVGKPYAILSVGLNLA